mmetsp:Transcript_49560/g.79092  ORF Transcript_49560/g.79092 Transcript_49560/m.79092 type:complete len:211 (-) Transcript_49560:602-1234(-)
MSMGVSRLYMFIAIGLVMVIIVVLIVLIVIAVFIIAGTRFILCVFAAFLAFDGQRDIIHVFLAELLVTNLHDSCHELFASLYPRFTRIFIQVGVERNEVELVVWTMELSALHWTATVRIHKLFAWSSKVVLCRHESKLSLISNSNILYFVDQRVRKVLFIVHNMRRLIVPHIDTSDPAVGFEVVIDRLFVVELGHDGRHYDAVSRNKAPF